jgi:hypothetical protein
MTVSHELARASNAAHAPGLRMCAKQSRFSLEQLVER